VLVDFVVPERWYKVDEVAEVIGFKRDTIIRLVKRGELEVLVLPSVPGRRVRIFSCRRILGAKIIRFVKKYTKRGSQAGRFPIGESPFL
jgi:excisionase family DNA binding protein